MTLLPALVYTDKSKIHGTGVFAGVDLPAWLHLLIPCQDRPAAKNQTVDDSFGDGLFPQAPFCYLNHSDEPNSEVVYDEEDLYLVLRQTVKADHELTIDYGDQYWEPQ